MARTKQTARKSTGGKAPRKHLATKAIRRRDFLRYPQKIRSELLILPNDNSSTNGSSSNCQLVSVSSVQTLERIIKDSGFFYRHYTGLKSGEREDSIFITNELNQLLCCDKLSNETVEYLFSPLYDKASFVWLSRTELYRLLCLCHKFDFRQYMSILYYYYFEWGNHSDELSQDRFPGFDNSIDHALDLNERFIFACYNGFSDLAQWLYEKGGTKIDIHVENEKAFRDACSNGHLEVVKWLYKTSMNEEGGTKIDIHVENEKAFRDACSHGHLEVVKWLYKTSMNEGYGYDLTDDEGDDYELFRDSFRVVCCYGKLEVAKWLHATAAEQGSFFDVQDFNAIDFDTGDDMDLSLFSNACSLGNLELAKWLYDTSLALGKGHSIRIYDDDFYRACNYGNLELAQWLYQKCLTAGERIDIHGGLPALDETGEEILSWDDGYVITIPVFRAACGKGHLELAEWLYKTSMDEEGGTKIDIHVGNEAAFRVACRKGHLEVAKWLYKTSMDEEGGTKIDIHAQDNEAFQRAKRHSELAKWLYETSMNEEGGTKLNDGEEEEDDNDKEGNEESGASVMTGKRKAVEDTVKKASKVKKY